MNIIHKDLKPENIVFEENGYARITDFGIAKHETGENANNNRNESSGTPVYMAP
jgi:serine/threonine protein kinase